MYIDALYQKNEGVVKVVERVNGKRIYKDYAPIFDFYVKDPKGRHKSIFGETILHVSANSEKEFQQLRRIHSHRKTYESDIKQVNKIIEANYLHQNPPITHNAFFDIETAFDEERGYSQPEDADNPIISIAVYLQWLGQVVCLALAPDDISNEEAVRIAEEVGNVILYDTEAQLLDAFLFLIEDADILSGWNSEGYDIPYTVNRIFKLLGKAESRRLCLWNQLPGKRTYSRGGKENVTYDLVGRIHLDYLQLYKKFTYEQKHSYALDAIAEAELGEKKVEYDGTLDDLYRQDFKKFLEYNIQDTMLLDRLDKKLQYIDLASSIAHNNCVLIPAAQGAVAVTEQAIIVEAHSRNMHVPDRERRTIDENSVYDAGFEDLEDKAAGGWVQWPKKGLHKWVGSTDLNSLYPSVIRAFNMSPETLVGQIRTTQTDTEIMQWMSRPGRQPSLAEWWNDRFNVLEMEYFYDNDIAEKLTLDLADGSEALVTGAELRNLIFNEGHGWMITANGTIFRSDIEGVVPSLLARWYAERQKMQSIKKEYGALAKGIELDIRKDIAAELAKLLENEPQQIADPYDIDQVFSSSTLAKKAEHKNIDELYKYMSSHNLILEGNVVTHRSKSTLNQIIGFWDKRQLVRKINLNSVYGGLLNVHCRFYDKRIGQSTTLTGRSITRHMAAKTNEFIDNEYDHTGRAVIYGDTDSVYFTAYPVLKNEIENGDIVWTKESVAELYDAVAEQVSGSFSDFLKETFNVPEKYGRVVKAGREIVGETGLFITKKRYAVLVYDDEGTRRDTDGKPGKLKIVGLDIRRSDTPKYVQKFLSDVLLRTLTNGSEDDVIQFIREFKEEFAKRKPWEKGAPKAVNNLTKYKDMLERSMKMTMAGKGAAKPTIPGHVMASINWNMMIERHNDKHATKIVDGQKIVVCKLKENNDYRITSIAYPVDETHLPDWFTSLPFDDDKMSATIVDKKVENLLGVLGWDLTRTDPDMGHMEELFDFS